VSKYFSIIRSGYSKKGLKLRYPIDFIKRKKQGILLYSLADFWFFMLKIPGVIKKDGAKRHHKSSIFNIQFRLVRVRNKKYNS
jgi:hypothetical protein